MRGFLSLLILVAAYLAVPPTSAHAGGESDDREALRARIEMIRKLPPEEQRRLRAALDRFRKLTPEQQQRIRDNAERVGDERLQELVGRDVKQLRRRNVSLQNERNEILQSLGGSQRFDQLPPLQKAYLAGVAVREFQRHVRRQLLDMGGPRMMEEFNRLSDDEKKARLTTALRGVEERLIAEESPESQAAIAAMSAREQKHMRKRLLVEYRLSLIPSFAGIFESRMIGPYLRRTEAERQAIAVHWTQRARWFEMRKRLDREVGVSRSTLRLLDDMGPEEWARVRDVYVRGQSDAVPAEEVRLKLENEIRELHGRTAFDSDERRAERKQEKQRLRRLMRTRSPRRASDGAQSDGTEGAE